VTAAPVVIHTEVAVEAAAEHAEGPLWDARDDSLMWVDQYRGIVRHAMVSASGALVEGKPFELGMPIGAIVPAQDDGWLVAAGLGFHHLASDGDLTLITDVLPNDGVRRRMNDGKLDPLGRFWAGSMAFDKTPGAGALYRLDGDQSVLMLDGVTISTAWRGRPTATPCSISTPRRRQSAGSM
jgi:sugar lactone lactonase YvrE